MSNNFRRSAIKVRESLSQYQNLYLVLIAVIIGVAAGAGNIVFRTAIAAIQKLCYSSGEEVVLPALQQAPFYKILVVPALGGLLVGVVYHFYKNRHWRGVPVVIKAIVMKTPIPWSVGVVTTFTSAVTLGTGGSAGREGPIVHIGASIGSAIASLFRFSPRHMRFAIASGAGGGLAATFNTPMAGAMFTAEVLLGKLEFQVFAPVVISCVSATVLSRAWFGDHVTFIAPPYIFTSPYEIPFYALMGVIVGIVGALFVKFYFYTADSFAEMKIPGWVKPAVGGLALGVIGLFCRNVMGVGYGTVMQILNENLTGYFLLLLVGLKIAATSLTLGSGGAGGLFVPSLFVGAALGGFCGWGAHALLPEYFSSSGSYALIGMGATLAATMRAPITSILMIFEITQSYQIVLPLMACVIIANVCAPLVYRYSFFSRPLADEGLDIQQSTEAAILSGIKVKDVMLTDMVTFTEDTPFSKILETMRRHPYEYFPVTGEGKVLCGMISFNDIRSALFEKGRDSVIMAGDFCTRKGFATVSPESTLADAMALFSGKAAGDLPVVVDDAGGVPRLVGFLKRSDMLAVYNKKIAGKV